MFFDSSTFFVGNISLFQFRPFVRWREVFGRFYPYGGVPFARRKHYHLVQELVNPGQQVLSVLGFVCNVVKDLDGDMTKIRRSRSKNDGIDYFWGGSPVFFIVHVREMPTSSDISVAIALPISWYDLALPLGPSRMNKNLQIKKKKPKCKKNSYISEGPMNLYSLEWYQRCESPGGNRNFR